MSYGVDLRKKYLVIYKKQGIIKKHLKYLKTFL